MICPFYRKRRIIDLTGSLRLAHDTGVQSGCAVSNETIDALVEQIARDRAEMTEEIARLRRQLSIDLEIVARELRETKQELHRLQLINQFAAVEHRDLSKPLH